MSESTTENGILFFIMFSLLIGGLLREVNKKFKVPYTPMLLIAGIMWGLVDNHLGLIGKSGEIMSRIDPHIILLVFLPALLFESSFSSDYHTFRREFWQILSLAGPGILVGAVLTGLVIRYVLNYKEYFGWADSLMLGAVLSATDPVAVVALLKEVGASKRLNTLIEGESLLNDGTAMVLFVVMFDFAKGESLSALDVIGKFFRLSLGGPLLGLLFGAGMVFWMKRIYNDSVMERTLMLFTTYLAFYIAEATSLHVSGILAIVALGLYMSAWGRTSIDVNSEEVIHNFWQVIGYIAETMIFLLSGIIIGEKVLGDEINLADWGKLVLLFVFLILVRGVVVLLAYPLFVKSVYGFTWQQAFILVYGGLRGAVGLSLALIIYGAGEEINRDVKDLSLFHTAGIASLTLLVNATTTGFFIEKLGLAKSSNVQEDVLTQVCRTVYDETKDSINDLKSDKFLRFADWKKVKELTELKQFIVRVLERTSTGKKITKEKEIEYNFLEEFLLSTSKKSKQEMENEIRTRFLTTLKGLYWHEYEKGQCEAETALLLIESANVALDEEFKSLKDWEYLENALIHGWVLKFFRKVKRVKVLGRICTWFLYNKMTFSYDVASTFLVCHEYAEATLRQVIDKENFETLESVISESDEQMELCRVFISENIELIFSEITRDIQTKKATYAVLMRQLNVINEFRSHGLIDDKEFKLMTHNIQKTIYRLKRKSIKSEMPNLRGIIPSIPFLEKLSQEKLEQLILNSREVLVQNEDYIFKEGNPAEGVYVILRGKVREFNHEGVEFFHGFGSIVGLQNLLEYAKTNLTSGKAESIVYAVFLKKSEFAEIHNNDEAYQEFWNTVSPALIKLSSGQFPKAIVSLEYSMMEKLVKLCQLGKYYENEIVLAETGGFLVSGCLQKVPENSIMNSESIIALEAPCFIQPKECSELLSGSGTAVVLHISEEMARDWEFSKNHFGILVGRLFNAKFGNLDEIKEISEVRRTVVNPREKTELAKIIRGTVADFSVLRRFSKTQGENH